MQVYPIGVIPKKHSTEWHTILNLSYPKHHPTSVNAHISPLDYSLHDITVDSAISIIQELADQCDRPKNDNYLEPVRDITFNFLWAASVFT